MDGSWILVGVCAMIVLTAAPWLAQMQGRAQQKRSGYIQCDVCPELMRPDGLHVVNNYSLLSPSLRIFRHPEHIIRTQILGLPILREKHEISN